MKNLEKYANLFLRKGVNLQEGQHLMLNASIDARELVEAVATVAYRDLKSGPIHINWNHGKLTRIALEHATEEVLLDFPDYQIEKLKELSKKGAALCSIVAPNPKLLAGIDPKLISKVSKESSIKTKFFSEEVMSGNLRWNVVAMPSKEWAAMVFPDLEEKEAMEKLWDYVFECTRVDQEDPIAAWDKHIETLEAKKKFLNENQFEKLIYTAPGTNLEVELPKGHIWVAGPKKANDGLDFIPNMPTEEVFTMNKVDGVNGTLRSTMPLNLRGSLIEDFSFVFKDGKIVDFDAKEGKEALEFLIKMDDGAARLGEVALVPYDSPISNLNTLFYNTLYDENASCHFAVGNAIDFAIKDGFGLSNEDKEELDINHSLTHVDFMVGASDLNITGIKEDGTKVPVFVNGNWA